jgi:hypothetical protein
VQSLRNAQGSLEIPLAHPAYIEERACRGGHGHVVHACDFVIGGRGAMHPDPWTHAAVLQ